MKKIVLAVFLAMFTMALVSPAYASYWYFDPGAGEQLEVTAGEVVAVELWFHSDETTFGAVGWDLDFQIDISEIDPATELKGYPERLFYKVDYELGFDTLIQPPEPAIAGGYLEGDIYTLSAGTLGSAVGISAGDTKFATLYFDVLDPVHFFDDLADIVLLSQIGTAAKGILDSDGMTLHQFAGADGPSVGTAVPIPAAVWLLGSGLLGLIGIRRRST
jgi:hypothetical protein